MNKYIILPNRKKFYYHKKEKVIERAIYNQGARYMTIYSGKDKQVVLFKKHWWSKGWYYEKPYTVASMHIVKQIEKRLQKERLKNKYKDLPMSTGFTFEDTVKIYKELTLCCDDAIPLIRQDYLDLGYNLTTDTSPLWEVIQETKKFGYQYNYLFTEWFEENQGEAN